MCFDALLKWMYGMSMSYILSCWLLKQGIEKSRAIHDVALPEACRKMVRPHLTQMGESNNSKRLF